MRIDDIHKVGHTSTVKKKAKKQEVGDFDSLLAEEPSSVSPVGATQPLQSLDGLIAAQEIKDNEQPVEREVSRGKYLLDRLDEIRHALLVGKISPRTVQNLVAEARREKAVISDPKLAEIINEIDIRAQVEITKLELEKQRINGENPDK